jgi:CRISPR-associated endonuclease/helicase Cas3
MLGVLQSRFATLRLSGLAGKVLVLDEVHAYDSYMLAIIERLVSWAAAMGTSVVLMSATLPSAMKQRLVRAFGDKHLTEEDSRAYPSVTWVERGSRPRTVRVEPADVSRRSVGLDRVAMHDVNDPGGVCSGLVRDAVAAEANVLVILNTVRRAQDAYGLLADEVGAERVLLLHARYRQVERERRERQVLDAYGRTGERPRGSLVVATQVIEQSLDVDFDLVVSDVAPVDLLLQRIGRLQRHARAGTRPAGYDEARCRLVLLDPPVGDGVPTPDAGTLRVYHEHAVLRTLVALAGRTAIAVPDDVRLLVEAVYDDRGPPDHLQANLAERWRSSARDLAAELTKSTAAAGNRIVGAPGDGSIDTDLAGTVGDDDRPVQGSLAQTRLGVSCPLVVLDAREAADLAEADPRVPRVAQDLLDRSLAVSQPALAYALFDEPVPAHWRRVPLLARHRLVVLDDDGRKRLGSAVMNMDRERGLVVDWERK